MNAEYVMVIILAALTVLAYQMEIVGKVIVAVFQDLIQVICVMTVLVIHMVQLM